MKESSSKLSEGYIHCGYGAYCLNTFGGFECVCRHGFKVNIGITGQTEINRTNEGLVKKITRCVDIDECTSQSVCPKQTKCQNCEGTYICNCFEGYDGDYCTDIDDCNSTHSCDVNAQCLNTDGSYDCSCKEGFYGSGDSCYPGRCPDFNCPKNQKCASPTTINCECIEGFRFNSLVTCVDIDECKEPKCDVRDECINTIGTFVCKEVHNSTAASTYTTSASTVLSTTKTLLTSTKTTALTTQTSVTTKRPIPTSFS